MILNQKEAAIYIGVDRNTLRNYEKRGLLKRVETLRPGAWYNVTDLNLFMPRESLSAQQAKEAN